MSHVALVKNLPSLQDLERRLARMTPSKPVLAPPSARRLMDDSEESEED